MDILKAQHLKQMLQGGHLSKASDYIGDGPFEPLEAVRIIRAIAPFLFNGVDSAVIGRIVRGVRKMTKEEKEAQERKKTYTTYQKGRLSGISTLGDDVPESMSVHKPRNLQ